MHDCIEATANFLGALRLPLGIADFAQRHSIFFQRLQLRRGLPSAALESNAAEGHRPIWGFQALFFTLRSPQRTQDGSSPTAGAYRS